MLPLSPPLTRDVVITRDPRVPMPDGVTLLADHWAPRDTPDPADGPAPLPLRPGGPVRRSTVLYGGSHLGYVQWAIADRLRPATAACAHHAAAPGRRRDLEPLRGIVGDARV